MKAVLQRSGLLLVVLLFIGGIYLYRPAVGREIIFNTLLFSRKMIIIMPPIFVLLSLLHVWVPADFVARYLGGKNGPLGTLLTIVLGSAASGPFYGAFPVAATMLQKGATFMNAMLFLGAWSIMKLPMVLYEISILGVKFGLTRMLVNIPGIIFIALLVDCCLSKEEKDAICRKSIYL
ncbi:MAG: permease [Firmicutes bacterium]|nr:permease [Bacillota bacterium]